MFQLPIQYNKHTEIDTTLIQDLELVQTVDVSGVPIYHHIFSPRTPVAKQIVTQLAKYYTTDTTFLNESILFHKRFNHTTESNDFVNHWTELKKNEEFKLTYQYINHDKLSGLNESSKFMFMISLYFITSPILFILSPLVMLIIPFAILHAQGKCVSWDNYKSQLFEVTKRHALVNLCTGYSCASSKEKMMMLASASIFLIQTYCNGYAVYKFYTNITEIHKIMESTKQHIKQSLDSIHYINSITSDLTTYKGFLDTLQHHENILSTYYRKLDHLSKLTFSWKEFVHLGMLRAQFYELYSNTELKASIEYSIQLGGYVENMEQLSKQLQKKINTCTFTKEKETSFSSAYYPTNKPVKNSYKLKKNIIITGPNASGKTTFIKMTLINTLLSQQFGCGFYKKAKIQPYDSFCSYINIPDTSGRDSLFQAEARRCKQVLESVKDKSKRVFCIFDELFSGTNPEEASASAFAFLQYLALQSNCTFLLTTHFINVCRNLKENETIVMKNMKTIKQKNKLNYTYKLANGLSTIHGGIHVLIDMDYPSDIIKNAKLCG